LIECGDPEELDKIVNPLLELLFDDDPGPTC
jgi:hypothetical protein